MADDTKKPHTSVEKSAVALREEKVLDFWTANRIFNKSVEKDAPKGDFVFYDGPPFATGLPHFGHVLPTSIKDAIPRYKTMQGYRVRRRWGWDCHGLPIENLIEKELGLKAKKDILDYGIGRFNEAARSVVLRYEHEWRRIIPRLGRFVDMDNDYKTMDCSYTESVWWAFKTLHDKGLIYEGFKSMQLCPRCETTLSNFEVNQGYKDITDISVYVRFELVDTPNTYMIAWTTTPWTLLGNVALAVHPDITYAVVEMNDDEHHSQIILAEERLEKVSAIAGKYKVIRTVKGSELVGKAYRPVFDYYSKNAALKNRANGWKIYAADFVTTTDGTGVVHIAPAFGPDDMELGKNHQLPFVQHVGTDGKFKKEVSDFAGQSVKPKDGTVMDKDGKPDKDAHQRGDIEIIKFLAATKPLPALFAKEKIVHSYAHCWRCDTPLLNYASSSWFVKVPDIKDKLVEKNSKVNWIPEEVGQGRFGNWLLGARDWAISRSRFWGAPLPVWKVEESEHDHLNANGNVTENANVAGNGEQQTSADEHHEEKMVVISSIEDLKKYSKARNTYYVIRHGEAENNVRSVISSTADVPHHLTTVGREQVTKAAQWLVDKKIDLIFVSPFVRTRETAAIVAKEIGVSPDRIIVNPSIGELNAGEYDGMNFKEFITKFPFEARFTNRPPGGENYLDIKRRMGAFLYKLEEEYQGKRILIVTHDSPAFILMAAAKGLDAKATLALRGSQDHFLKNAEPALLDFVPLPHNLDFELDLHRPYIDDLKLYMPEKDGSITESSKRLVRVPEVFDCWFESGSMPFGEAHYPFDEKGDFEPQKGLFKKSKGYPADFIAEGQDQTRGWFYSMLVLGVALFDTSPYKNVIVNGIVLAEDGQKLSKSKKNYPDLMLTVDKFGADALRFYLLASPLVRAQEFAFSERGVDEVAKKHIGRLSNIVSFFELYIDNANANTDARESSLALSILDRWMMVRLKELTHEVTRGLDTFEIDRAARPFADFIDDFSTWYVRRSRDRFKNDDADKRTALATLQIILTETAKLIAPFMPFLAEDIYLRVTKNSAGNVCESVHLESWPLSGAISQSDKQLLSDMQEVRRLTTLILEARMNAKINVRQPLARVTVTSTLSSSVFLDELMALIKDEVNIKEVLVKPSQAGDTAPVVELDTVITDVLKAEGTVRELVRTIQDLRKKTGLTVSDLVDLVVVTDERGHAFIEQNKIEIMKTTGLKSIVFDSVEKSPSVADGGCQIGDFSMSLSLKK